MINFIFLVFKFIDFYYELFIYSLVKLGLDSIFLSFDSIFVDLDSIFLSFDYRFTLKIIHNYSIIFLSMSILNYDILF